MRLSLKHRKYYRPGITYILRHGTYGLGSLFFDDPCIEYVMVRIFNRVKLYRIGLHAYCVCNDNIHLLATPATPAGISSLWRTIASEYGWYYENRFDRPGQLLLSRLESMEVSDNNLVECQIFIEHQPLSEGLVEHPAQHRWSSFANNGLGMPSHYLTKHRQYQLYLNEDGNSLHTYRNRVVSYGGNHSRNTH